MSSVGAYDVFISYARSDGDAAAELNGWLVAQGFSTFFDRSALKAGLRWVPALEEAIGRARAVAILVGPHGIGATQQYERELSLVRQTGDPAFLVIPVLTPGCEQPPTGFLRLLTWVDFSKGKSIREQTGGLEVLRAALRGEAVPASTLRASICPYRGLEPFREEDAAFFCGRDGAIGELIARVREHNFVVVVGPSGSGKSSLVFAGLLPALRRQDSTTMWDVVTLRPGKRPLHALSEVFGTLPDDAGPSAIDAYLEGEAAAYRAGDADKLARIVDRRLDGAPEKPDRLLIYVDQWEELYAMAPPAEDKERAREHAADVEKFVALLVAATTGARSRANIVLTVRADFYNPLIANPLLSALLPRQQVNIPPMGREDLRAAIETPAALAELSFSPSQLVDQILDEVGLEEGRLPLLQFALKETWQRREGDQLTSKGYTEVGGVARAIEKTADSAYQNLTGPQQEAARRLFLRLVTLGEGQTNSRARSLIPDDPLQREIIDRFANQKTRLLVTGFARLPGGAGASAGDMRATVEVAHEALIQRWPTLRAWVTDNQENLRSRAAILRFKVAWEESGKSDRYLLDAGVQLERGRALLEKPGDVAVDDIRDYVDRSIAKDARKRIFAALKRIAQSLLALIVVPPISAWAALALWFRFPGPEVARAFAAALFLVLGLATVVALSSGRRRALVIAFALAFGGLLMWWGSIEPPANGDWTPDVAWQTTGAVDGDILTLTNVRNFDWRSDADFTERWEKRTYDLSKLKTLDLYLAYWAGPQLAHLIMSFGFEGGEFLAWSIEVRREKGGEYSPVAEVFKSHTIIVLAADERDVVRLRSNVRLEDVRLYRLRASAEGARALLLEYVAYANEIAVKPDFYDTFTNSSTTAAVRMVRAAGGVMSFDWRFIVNGFLPGYLYELGRLDSKLPLHELIDLARIDLRAKDADRSPDFSRLIRVGVPSPN